MAPPGLGFVTRAIRSTVAFFTSKARRQSFLILVAYVSAIVGVFLALAAGEPTSKAGLASAGIGLMGLSFVLMFFLSISFTSDGPRRNE